MDVLRPVGIEAVLTPNESRAPRVLALAMPFLIAPVLDYFYVGRRYFDLASDEAPHFWFGHSLAWLTHPELKTIHTTHIPGIPFNQVGSLLLDLFRDTSNPPEVLAVAGIVLSVIAAIAAAFWGASLGRQLSLPPIALFAMASLVAVQPSLTLFPHSAYYYLGLLSLPMGLGMALALQGRGAGTSTLAATSFVLGFAASLHFAALQLAVAFGVALVTAFLLPQRREVFESCARPRPSVLMKALMLGGVGLFVAGYASASPTSGADAGTEVELALASAILAWLLLRQGDRFAFPVLPIMYMAAGWLLGCNVIWRHWAGSLLRAYETKGGMQGANDDVWALLWAPATSTFLSATPWRWLVMVLPVLALLACLVTAVRDWRAGLRFVPCVIFASALSFIVVLSAVPAGQFYFGALLKSDRFFIGATAAIPVVVALLWEALPRLRALVTVACLAMALGVYTHYVSAVSPTVREARRLDAQIAPLVEKFRAENPEGTVLCSVALYVPEVCSSAFAYTWHAYLIGQEAAKYVANPVRTTPMLGCDSAETCLGEPLPVTKPFLLIARPEYMPESIRSAGDMLFDYKTPIAARGMGHTVQVVLLRPASAGIR